MVDESLVITESGFLTEFLNQHGQRTDRPFCFILGAGVSRPSGIPTGADMAALWLKEIYEAENFDDLPMEEWATEGRLGIPGFTFDRVAHFYPQLYRRRYAEHDQAGYAFLESQMEGKEPSYGYSVLAYLLSETSHKVVVTTNFDNLVADALSIHSSRFPIVVGHDALAQYAAVELRRPLVAKIHGALGFAPKSKPDDIADLPEGWCIALRRILERYTPIFIGYEGNDGSLMRFLESLPEQIPDRVLWCVYAPDAKPKDCLDRVSADVRKYVRARRGRFAPIRGFDELMAKLLSRLREKGSVPDLYQRLKERARQREHAYDEQQRKLFEASVSIERTGVSGNAPLPLRAADPALSEAVSEIAESRKDKPWWVWSREAFKAPDLDGREAIFLQGLEAHPESPDLRKSYAFFLERDRRDLDRAEEAYQHALRLDTKHAAALAFYADFLVEYRNDPDGAEKHFLRSLDADPNDEFALLQYAALLEAHKQDMDGAEKHYLRILDVNPRYVWGHNRYASFLERVRKDMDKAEEHYRRALDVDPKHVFTLQHYANFLRSVRGDAQKADEVERRTQSDE